jgi:hypothetical protein
MLTFNRYSCACQLSFHTIHPPHSTTGQIGFNRSSVQMLVRNETMKRSSTQEGRLQYHQLAQQTDRQLPSTHKPLSQHRKQHQYTRSQHPLCTHQFTPSPHCVCSANTREQEAGGQSTKFACPSCCRHYTKQHQFAMLDQHKQCCLTLHRSACAVAGTAFVGILQQWCC